MLVQIEPHYDMGSMFIRDSGIAQPIPIGTLTSALANATLEQQRMMLGESLYPLVDQLEHDHSAKVTGMLLELDHTMILHFLESPEDLKAIVAEAIDVLRDSVGGIFSVAYDTGGMPKRDLGITQPISIGSLVSALANATPETQRMMLGERLYPLVDQLEHDHAAKVTGMLLEMDKSEILHLLETHEALKAKVAEAMAVLRNVAGGMLSVPFDMGGMPIRDCGITQPIPIGALASALANAATLEQQMTFLGERLYPLVDQLEHDHAAKVTGMLLEMDQTEILHLLESPEALKAKVAEAMKVLRDAAGDMLPSPYDKVHIPIQAIDILQPMPIGALALALADATPEQQRVAMGERLYPLVYQLVYDYAPKVTGMLLEMHQTEVLHLLESPEALKAKVAEAMGVLRNAVGGMLPIPCDMCGMLSAPYDTGGMLFVPYDTDSLHFLQDFGITHLIPIQDLTSALADSTPEQQRVMLGERLYPLLDQLGIEHAVKAIGMLLKMDKTTALYLLDSLEAFEANVGGHGDSLKCCSAATVQSTV